MKSGEWASQHQLQVDKSVCLGPADWGHGGAALSVLPQAKAADLQNRG